MSNRFLFISFLILLVFPSCNGKTSGNQQNEGGKQESPQIIKNKISKIPISPLPIGLANIDNIDSLDLRNLGMFELPINYEVDIDNRYGLNHISEFYVELSLPHFDAVDVILGQKSEREVYFCKRLPPKDGYEILLFKQIQKPLNSFNDSYESWILVPFRNGKIGNYYIVAQSLRMEEVQRYYVVFSLDEEYNLKLRGYRTDYYQALEASTVHCCGYQSFRFYKDVDTSYFELEDEGIIDDNGSGWVEGEEL